MQLVCTRSPLCKILGVVVFIVVVLLCGSILHIVRRVGIEIGIGHLLLLLLLMMEMM